MNKTIRQGAWLVWAALLFCALGFGPAVAQEASTPQERLEALVTRMRKVTNEYFQNNWKDDLTDAQRGEVYAKRPGLEFIPEFEALAVEGKGTDVAASARMEVFSIQCDFQKKEDAGKTLERLLSESITSKVMTRMPSTIQYRYTGLAGREASRAALEKLLEKSPHKEVQASSLFALGSMLCESEADRPAGRKCFERVIAEFGDVKRREGTYKQAAEAFLFELDHLQIGMTAPDFESVDENGVKFKLSDYRGKVTVIDFWGNW